jgi:tellurite methyltransferase
MNNSWPEFYKVTKDRPPWPIVEQAVEILAVKGRALDLGCGAGRDTRWLLSQGWDVTAVDQEPAAIALLADVASEKLRAVQSSISDFDFTPESYDLISAQFSLPFLPRAAFFDAFERLKDAIKPGGLFVGQFFGVHDSWNNTERDMTFLTHKEVEQVLAGLTVLELKEDDHDGTTALGDTKHWHVYHIMARRELSL